VNLPISDRATAEAATMLIATYGDDAGVVAAERAESSRDRGNLVHFCRWRQVERMVVALSIRHARGTIH
jgi:hypothetical protein